MNTSKIEQLEAQLTALQAELNKLKNLENSKNWPSDGEVYYCVTYYGKVNTVVFDDDHLDQGAKAIGNMFRTREEAEKELEARKVIAELRMQPGSKRFVVCGNNFCVGVDLKCLAVGVDYLGGIPQGFGQAYFYTEKDAENAIETVGSDRILAAAKWLAMGV